MTSFAETHPQIRSTLGGPLSLKAIRQAALVFFRRLRTRCGEGCSSGGSGGASGGVQCPDVEISLENLRSNLMSSATGASSLSTAAATASVGRGYPAFTCSFTGSTSSALGPMGLGTYAALNASNAGMNSFAFNTARGSSPRSSLGTQRGSIASTMSGTLRKPSGSTLISLAGMLAERDPASLIAATAPVASTTATSTPMGSGTLNGSAPSVRERRSSRGSESQERDVRLRRSGAASESTGATARQRSSSGRTSEDDRLGARERSRRRDRSRRDRFDRLESHDTDRPLYETEPFMDNRIGVDQRVKVNLVIFETILVIAQVNKCVFSSLDCRPESSLRYH